MARCWSARARVFQGYYKQPEATRDAVNAEGWFRTGDAGLSTRAAISSSSIAPGMSASSPTAPPFAPQFIENKLKFSPYIGEAVAFGDCRPFVAAIIAIDLATVGNWAERHNLAYTSFQDLSAKSEVRAADRRRDRPLQRRPARSRRIRRFLLLNKEFDADDNEITRTRKIRRRFVAEKYAAVVEAFYGDGDAVELTTEITYEDGRKDAALDAGDRRSTTVAGAARAGARARPSPELRRCRGFEWQFTLVLVTNGVMIGLMYALIALGFVLIYKATDAINFAQGEFVMFAGFHRRRRRRSRRAAVLGLGAACGRRHGGARFRPRACRAAAADRAADHRRDHGDDRLGRGAARRRRAWRSAPARGRS